MTAIDVLCLTSLAVMTISWWLRGLPARRTLLIVTSLAALLAALLGLLMHRWQVVPAALLAIIVLGVAIVKPPRPGTLPWISGPIVTAWSLLIGFLIYLFPVNNLPPPSGEMPVGVRDFELVDPSRTGVLGAAEGEPRRLLVRVWYPATDRGVEPRPYFTELEADTTATGTGALLGMPFFSTYTRHVATNSFEGAPFEADEDPMPVIMYSHGYTSYLGQNWALMEELASHGYLVFSMQHTGDSSPTVFPDGDVVPSDPALLAAFDEAVGGEEGPDYFRDILTSEDVDARRAATLGYYQSMRDKGERIVAMSADHWLKDREFLLDTLAEGRVPEEVASIVAAGDYRSTGQAGMSFGGSTTGGLCMNEPRCAAAVNLDGGDYHFQPFNRHIPVPFMMFYSDYNLMASMLTEGEVNRGHGFNDFSYERPETAGYREDVYRFVTKDVQHFGVSDMTYFVRNPAREMVLGAIDGERMLAIQNDLVRGFFDRHVRGIENSYPDSALAEHAQWTRQEDMTAVRESWLAAHPEDTTVRVMLETDKGDIEVAVYPERAPISAGNFLAHIDAGDYNGAVFYRATKIRPDGSGIAVVQGGLASAAMAGEGDEQYTALSAIEHETTTKTGISNERGTLAYARFDPGTAGTEIFFNVQDNPNLDSGVTAGGRDGHGYATFGRVIRGLPVLEAIQQLPTDRPTTREVIQGQLLTEPVVIRRAYRVPE